MSGIEVVGLVLGALPLLVKSIDAYSETLSTARRIFRPHRELRNIRSRVNVALQLFRNVAKLLLIGIVGFGEASSLLQEPGSKKWRDAKFERKLKGLLGESYSAWHMSMDDINSAVEDIRTSLRISIEEVNDASTFGQNICLHNGWLKTSDRVNASQRLRLGLNKEKVDNALKRIDSGTARFQRLTDSVMSLAAINAQICSLPPDFRQMRAAANQSFSIMESGLQCQCKSSHVLCLGLGRIKKGHSSPETHEDHRIVLASQSGSGQPVRVEYVADVEISIPFLEGRSGGQTNLLGGQHWTNHCTCLSFLASSGMVTDSASIVPPTPLSLTSRHNVIPVHTLLPVTSRQKRKLRARGKRHIALMASWSLLRLYSTPWLQDDLFQKEISFIRGDDGSLIDLPFISKRLEPAVNLTARSRLADPEHLARVRNAWVYALGIFLIELCLGQTVTQLREPQDEILGGKVPLLTEFNTAIRLIDEVVDQAGLRYGTAVSRCVRCNFDVRVYDLDNTKFCQVVYQKVVALLEEDILQQDGGAEEQCGGQYVCF
jgi:hypothetical protein